MLNMTDDTKIFLQNICPHIPMDRAHLNELLDYLDDVMLNTLDKKYRATAKTLPVCLTYDDLFASNE